jgi:hypothetical protein
MTASRKPAIRPTGCSWVGSSRLNAAKAAGRDRRRRDG